MSLGGGSGVHRPPYHSAGQPSEPAGQRRVRGPGPIRAGQRRTAGTGTGTDPISDGVRGGRGRVTSRDREAGRRRQGRRPDLAHGSRRTDRPVILKLFYSGRIEQCAVYQHWPTLPLHWQVRTDSPTPPPASPTPPVTIDRRPAYSRPSHQRHQRHQWHQWGTGQNSRPGR